MSAGLALAVLLTVACEAEPIDWRADAEHWHQEYQDAEGRAVEAEQ